MIKFKPGDRVICVRDSDDGSFTGHPGETFTVSRSEPSNYGAGENIWFEETPEDKCGADPGRFELVGGGPDLEFLLKTANEGAKAEYLLLEKFLDKVERKRIKGDIWTSFAHNPYNKGYSVYREKPKPVFEPFYIGSAEPCNGRYMDCSNNPDHKPWKVELKDNLLCIGTDLVFDPIPLMKALADLTRDSISGCTISGRSLDCIRNGIVIQGKYQISWEDAELVLKALEGVCSK